ncbi:hypothetical protein OOZ15_00275 [Galbibacter sp. EGI 63066]|uniref:hypothetical protein n=1 Tax=Galbibacter sp. EGI 63066 TaxID=2993559 RepID=UPI002248D1F3|nr:hypothetical protein [Galbibacter sp. EGI 63066]MCX2678364.1 hypothetical protein [Galbibacter sp. EGI 63066]
MMTTKYDIKPKLLLWLMCFLFGSVLYSQTELTGVLTSTPITTLDIRAVDEVNPSNDTGIIVPRVTSLNIGDPKETGLLVFYETNDNDRGFYWWDGTAWQPFISLRTKTSNIPATYASCMADFTEGPITENLATSVRTLEFESLQSNDPLNYELNANGELVVKKAGTYFMMAVAFISKTSGVTARDAFEVKILVNGNNASNSNSSFDLEGASGFPSGGLFTNIVNISGALKLDVDDRLIFQVNRYYRDTGGGDITIEPNSTVRSNILLSQINNTL